MVAIVVAIVVAISVGVGFGGSEAAKLELDAGGALALMATEREGAGKLELCVLIEVTVALSAAEIDDVKTAIPLLLAAILDVANAELTKVVKLTLCVALAAAIVLFTDCRMLDT